LTQLYIDEVGSVKAADLHQPFAALITGSMEEQAATVMLAAGMEITPNDAQTDERGGGGQTGRPRSALALGAIWDVWNVKTPRQTALTRGSNVACLADLREGLSNPAPQVQRLLNMADHWIDDEKQGSRPQR
jgi:hypothetical protein